MWHPVKHLKTITHHHNLVMIHCFKCGLYFQGLTHDLSKLSPVEFFSGAKYFQGTQSPNNAQRKAVGYSSAWLHHKGRNKHHMEYWIDYTLGEGAPMGGMKMPTKYLVEMVCDRIAASKTYRGKDYKDSDPYDYYLHGRGHYLIHPETDALLEKCLRMLAEEGEAKTFSYIKHELLKK